MTIFKSHRYKILSEHLVLDFIFKTVVAVLLFYIFGRLSFVISVSEGMSTPIFLPAGVGVAVYYFWGRSSIVGILLGLYYYVLGGNFALARTVVANSEMVAFLIIPIA